MSTDASPDPTPRCRAALNSIGRVRAEMAKLYRLARSKELPLADATKLVFILSQIAGLIANEELEVRVEALESMAEQMPAERLHH